MSQALGCSSRSWCACADVATLRAKTVTGRTEGEQGWCRGFDDIVESAADLPPPSWRRSGELKAKEDGDSGGLGKKRGEVGILGWVISPVGLDAELEPR